MSKRQYRRAEMLAMIAFGLPLLVFMTYINFPGNSLSLYAKANPGTFFASWFTLGVITDALGAIMADVPFEFKLHDIISDIVIIILGPLGLCTVGLMIIFKALKLHEVKND